MTDHSDCCSYHGCVYDDDDNCPMLVNGWEGCSECEYWDSIDEDNHYDCCTNDLDPDLDGCKCQCHL